VFDLEDIDAAFAELDARYLAGEAAAHAHTWSTIARMCAAFNRHEIAPTTPDSVYIDHRPLYGVEAGGIDAHARATWDVTPDVRTRIEAVHRLSELGVVLTSAMKGTSPEGFDAEWRTINILTVDGDRLNRCEVFDETDLDAAIARFDEMSRPEPALKNAASKAWERIYDYFAARDWAALAEITAENISVDDRRRVVNAGLINGRDANIESTRALAEVGFTLKTLSVMATRGARLALIRVRASGHDPETIANDALIIAEVDSDGRIAAVVVFDQEDIDAAFAELDTRYLAGEAAAHSHTWSVIAAGYGAFNRRERFPTTPDWVNIDHRRGGAFAPGDMTAAMHAAWDLMPDASCYIEAVHRLTNLGAVVTSVTRGTAEGGFDAEWRQIDVSTVEGDLVNRCEIFDEADVDVAVSRFEELHPQTPQLENAASQAVAREWACFATRDWAAMAETMTDDFSTFDHRRVVNAGVLRGRDAHVANYRAVAEVGFEGITSTVIATRGQRLALIRVWSSARGFEPGETGAEMIGIVEVDAEDRLTAAALFDLVDIDAAFEELDARYVAGEAADHAHTWSVIARERAAFNRHEFAATTPNPVYIDHRPLVSIPAGVDLAASQRAVWDLTPDASTLIEAVHRLSELGAVVTQVVKGTSPEGFDAEWQMISVLTVEGDLISHFEVFDEADLDAALARFEELSPQVRRLDNAASRAHARLRACVVARDWNALTEILADDIAIDDRRRVVNSGIQYGRDAAIADMRGAIDLGLTNISLTVTATRGNRLELSRTCIGGQDRPDAFRLEFFSVLEINADEQIVARVAFDPEDIDAAFAELDARYLAGEAAAHAHTWSVIARECAAFNRHELPAADWITIDQRRLAPIDANDLQAAMRAVWDLTPDLSTHIEAVHWLGSFGAVVTYTAHGTTSEGFDAEWRMIELLTVQGDRMNRCEIFDEADLDAALARFDELDRLASS
jgi:hypothetical protein